jgi:hypothetical protein
MLRFPARFFAEFIFDHPTSIPITFTFVFNIISLAILLEPVPTSKINSDGSGLNLKTSFSSIDDRIFPLGDFEHGLLIINCHIPKKMSQAFVSRSEVPPDKRK